MSTRKKKYLAYSHVALTRPDPYLNSAKIYVLSFLWKCSTVFELRDNAADADKKQMS